MQEAKKIKHNEIKKQFFETLNMLKNLSLFEKYTRIGYNFRYEENKTGDIKLLITILIVFSQKMAKYLKVLDTV